jgi:hydroxyethylthiazole kinase-like uncharacterized protein yjeF
MRLLSLIARPLTLLSSSIIASSNHPSHSLFRNPRLASILTSVGFVAAWTTQTTTVSTALRGKSSGRAYFETNNSMDNTVGYLNATAAAALDEELMSQPGFTLEQLMELAGFSVAQAVYQVVEKQQQHRRTVHAILPKSRPHILVICGPGNNGGDGLVAARHLVHFGYDCTVVYPKRSSSKQHYSNLVQQCFDMGIVIRDDLPEEFDDDALQKEQGGGLSVPYAAIVDAIFGFSFIGTPREPFCTILQKLTRVVQDDDSNTIIVAVDIPSGWDVDHGAVHSAFRPAALVSLTAPKLCARFFTGRHHFCGGRFLPPALARKYNLRVPPYVGTEQIVELPTRGGGDVGGDCDDYDWQKEHAEYLVDKSSAVSSSIIGRLH